MGLHIQWPRATAMISRHLSFTKTAHQLAGSSSDLRAHNLPSCMHMLCLRFKGPLASCMGCWNVAAASGYFFNFTEQQCNGTCGGTTV